MSLGTNLLVIYQMIITVHCAITVAPENVIPCSGTGTSPSWNAILCGHNNGGFTWFIGALVRNIYRNCTYACSYTTFVLGVPIFFRICKIPAMLMLEY